MKKSKIVILTILPILSVFTVTSGRVWIAASYYKLIKDASDILVITVVRVDGEKFSEKAVAKIDRSLKRQIHSDSIELPFIYREWPSEKGHMMTVSETVPVSFQVGKRYVVLVKRTNPSMRKFGNPHTAQTDYEVIQYPDRTYFELQPDNQFRLWEIEQLLKIAEESDISKQGESLISLLKDDHGEIRADAVEALTDIRFEGAAEALIGLLQNDPDERVRYSVATALRFLHHNGINNALLQSSREDKSRAVRFSAIGSLGMQHAYTAIPILLGLYQNADYDARNAILGALNIMRDSVNFSSVRDLYVMDSDNQHRHSLTETIALMNTKEAEEFAAALLDTCSDYWLKSAVLGAWAQRGLKDRFDGIVKFTSIPCASEKNYRKERGLQGFLFSLILAIGKLGSPEQVATTIRVYASCQDSGVRDYAMRTLQDLLKKDISPQLKNEIQKEINEFKLN